jgi:hypothetical protein
MALTTKNVKAQQPYSVRLSFVGIAKYAIVEYVPNGTGWKVGNVVQADGHSADAQADQYGLTPLAPGEKRLVAVGANMSSATGDEDVSVTASFTQAGSEVYSDAQSGHDSGDIVMLWSRTVFVGEG